MTVPTNLNHKPIIAIDNYDRIDGQYANDTDAMALSIGVAQWDENDISAKVFRQPNGRWSPQSEELPPHRVIDLCTLIIASFIRNEGLPITNLNEAVIDDENLHRIEEYYQRNREVLLPKIQELGRIINLFNQSITN